jgi:protein-tyrosine phosphatase
VNGDPRRQVAVCFVCTGNICRSPMAAAVLERMAAGAVLHDGTDLASRLVVTSAGTGGWHVGERIDPRAGAALEGRGSRGDHHRARSFDSAWFAAVDLVVCLDRGHRQTLAGLARTAAGDDRYEDRLVLLRSFDRRSGGDVDVPDPYYGDDADFEACLDLVEAGCRGLIAHLVGRVDQLDCSGEPAG